MKILHRLYDILDKIKDSIATPYILVYHDIGAQKKEIEIGYCLVNELKEVTTKYVITTDIVEFSFSPSMSTYLSDINFEITPDGYIRFWTSNVNCYLKWDLTTKKEAKLELVCGEDG